MRISLASICYGILGSCHETKQNSRKLIRFLIISIGYIITKINMSDRTPPHSPARPFRLANVDNTTNTTSVSHSDIEHMGCGRKPLVDSNNKPETALLENLTTGPSNTNVTLRIAQEKSSLTRSRSAPCGGMIFKVLLIYGLVATGIGGYLLKQFFRIPSLQNEVNQLSKQVDRLKVEIAALQ